MSSLGERKGQIRSSGRPERRLALSVRAEKEWSGLAKSKIASGDVGQLAKLAEITGRGKLILAVCGNPVTTAAGLPQL
jgi:hypothetical protein